MYGFVIRGKARDVWAVIRYAAFLEMMGTTTPYILSKECSNLKKN